MNLSLKQLYIDHAGHQKACCYTLSNTEWDLLVGVYEGVLIHRAGPLLIFLPEARKVFPAFRKALGVFWLLFQHQGH